MPIIEPPIPGAPLSQGDILKGIPLFFSKRGAGASWECGSDKKNLCLVLSRQCVVEHKKLVTVAAIDKYSNNTPDGQDFKGALLFLENLRDGNKSPDLFYLGQLPDMQGRFCARLDFLGTIEVPQVPIERQPFIDQYRIAKLHKDYIRDLHVRVHQAFANMGFEDYQWLSDADLKWLIATGEAEINKDKEDQKASQAAREAEGKLAGTGRTNRIADLKKRMEPYAAELTRRPPSHPSKQRQKTSRRPVPEPSSRTGHCQQRMAIDVRRPPATQAHKPRLKAAELSER